MVNTYRGPSIEMLSFLKIDQGPVLATPGHQREGLIPSDHEGKAVMISVAAENLQTNDRLSFRSGPKFLRAEMPAHDPKATFLAGTPIVAFGFE